MTYRWLLSVIAALLLITGCGDSESELDSSILNDHTLFPLEIGNIWKYERIGEVPPQYRKPLFWGFKAISLENGEAMLQQWDQDSEWWPKWTSSDSELVCKYVDIVEFHFPISENVGETWTTTVDIEGRQYGLTTKLVSLDSIHESDVGTFSCHVYESYIADGGEERKFEEFWFAEGIGPVKYGDFSDDVESGEYSIIGYKVGNTEIGDTIFPESLEGSSVEIFRANEQTNEIRGLEYDHIRKELVISYTDADRNDQLLLLSKDGAIRGNIDGDFQYSHGTFIDDAGFYYVCDTHNERVLKITREGQIQLEIPFPEEMGQLADIAVDSEGNIYVISQPTGDWVHLIHSFDASGALRFSIGSEGTGDGEFGRADKASTNSIVVDELNDRFIVTDYENNRLQVFSLSGDFISIWKPTGLTISKPQALAMDNNGYIYVAATNLFVLSSTGEIVEWFARLDDPYGIDIDEDGFIYVASRSGHHILRVEPR